jgi:predicted CXXCH cytochrome family protein
MRFLPPLIGLAVGLGVALGMGSCGEEEHPLTPAAPLTDTSAVAKATWDNWYKPQRDRIPEALVTSPGTPWGDYVGSPACGACHAEEYARWRKSFHSRTLYDAKEGTVLGAFDGRTLDLQAYDKFSRRPMPAPYIAEVFQRKDADGRVRYYMHLRERTEEEGWPRGRRRDTYGDDDHLLPLVGSGVLVEVVWTFGNRRHQPYVARWNAKEGDRLNDGKFWTLPFFYNDAEKEWQYCGFRAYTDSCASCHTTGIKRSTTPWFDGQRELPMLALGTKLYNLRPKEEGWAEGAVGCEVCHGPGLEHVRAVDKVGEKRYAELRKAGAKPPSIFPSNRQSETLERLTEQCDSCHNFHTESTITFVPGPKGYDHKARHRPLLVQEDPGHFQHFPDGSKKSPCSIGAVYRTSKMFEKGVACFDCHDPHGSDHFGSLKLPIHDNSLCISCHIAYTEPEAQLAHSKHKEGSSGNRCVECHMPRHMVFTNGQQKMSDRIHNHVFSIPKGGAREGAPPTSCNICHTDRDEAWSAKEIKRLWVPGDPGSDAPPAQPPGSAVAPGGAPPPGPAPASPPVLPPDPLHPPGPPPQPQAPKGER